MKTCSKCGLEKDRSEFHKNPQTICGLQSNCKACQQIYNLGVGHKLAVQKYEKTHKGKLNIRKKFLKYEKTPNARQRTKRYRQSKKGRLTLQQINRHRRDRERNVDTQLTHKDVKLVYERFKNRCFNCKSTEHLAIDHHYPLNKGHGLALDNAVLLCRSCNSSKHDKMPEDFYTRKQLQRLAVLLRLVS